MPDFLIQGLLTDAAVVLIVGFVDGIRREFNRRDELVAARDEMWRKYRL